MTVVRPSACQLVQRQAAPGHRHQTIVRQSGQSPPPADQLRPSSGSAVSRRRTRTSSSSIGARRCRQAGAGWHQGQTRHQVSPGYLLGSGQAARPGQAAAARRWQADQTGHRLTPSLASLPLYPLFAPFRQASPGCRFFFQVGARVSLVPCRPARRRNRRAVLLLADVNVFACRPSELTPTYPSTDMTKSSNSGIYLTVFVFAACIPPARRRRRRLPVLLLLGASRFVRLLSTDRPLTSLSLVRASPPAAGLEPFQQVNKSLPPVASSLVVRFRRLASGSSVHWLLLASGFRARRLRPSAPSPVVCPCC